MIHLLEKQQQQNTTRFKSFTAVSKFVGASEIPSSSESSDSDALLEQIIQVGSVLKVRWTAEKLWMVSRVVQG